jgi:hypothetical protein
MNCMLFWHRQAYEIAHKITGGHPLHEDLVSHTYLILSKHNIPSADLPRTFARFAWNQWKWPESEFNKLFKADARVLSYDIDIEFREKDEEDLSEYKQILEEHLEKSPENDQELFLNTIVKMHLCGMTFRDIKSETGLSLRVIHSAIKQFKYDLHSFYSVEHRDSPCDADL